MAAIILVFDPEGKVLVLRRSRTDPWRPLHWDFPGGFLKATETPRAGVLRELAEETGVHLGTKSLSWAFGFRQSGRLTHVFLARLSARPPVSFPDAEHDRAIWVDLHRLPQPVIPGVRLVVERVIRSCSTASCRGPLSPRAEAGESGPGGRVEGWPKNYAYWPKYLPYPTALGRNPGWVPNRTSVDWPQAQFAPLYLPPGSPSFQPFSYPGPGTAVASPLYVLQSLAYEGHSMVGPEGDLAQLPPPYSFGDHTMAYGTQRAAFNSGRARFNPEDAAVAQLLDTPVSVVPTETVVAEITSVTPVVPVASDAQAAVVVAASVPFTLFPPELLVGLKPHRLAQFQQLETTLTKLSAMQRGPELEHVYQHLLKVHDHVNDRLEKRLEKRAARKGRKHHVRRHVKALRARRTAHHIRRVNDVGGHGLRDARQDVRQIHQVREAFQAGKIGREQAEHLMKVAIRS